MTPRATPRRSPRMRKPAGAYLGRSLALIAILGALGGCGLTPQGDAISAGIANKGAEAADRGLVNAEWFLCNAATIGSIKRKYGVSHERSEAYNRFCPDTSAVPVIVGRDPLAGAPFVPSPLEPPPQ